MSEPQELPDDHQIGANKPPEPIDEFSMVYIGMKSKPMLDKALALASKAVPIVTTAADVEIMAAEHKAAKELWEDINSLRTALKRPIDARAKEVQEMFVPHLNRLETYRRAISEATSRWQRSEQDRQREEAAANAKALQDEADRRQETADTLRANGLDAAADGIETAAGQAANQASALNASARGSGSDLVRMQTSSGGVSSQGRWVCTIANQAKARGHVSKALRDHMKVDAILAAGKSYMAAEVKAGRTPELKGFTFTRETSAVFR